MGLNRWHPIREILDEFIEKHGWDDETVFNILCDFIQSRLCPTESTIRVNDFKDAEAFREYLQHRVDTEHLVGEAK